MLRQDSLPVLLCHRYQSLCFSCFHLHSRLFFNKSLMIFVKFVGSGRGLQQSCKARMLHGSTESVVRFGMPVVPLFRLVNWCLYVELNKILKASKFQDKVRFFLHWAGSLVWCHGHWNQKKSTSSTYCLWNCKSAVSYICLFFTRLLLNFILILNVNIYTLGQMGNCSTCCISYILLHDQHNCDCNAAPWWLCSC